MQKVTTGKLILDNSEIVAVVIQYNGSEQVQVIKDGSVNFEITGANYQPIDFEYEIQQTEKLVIKVEDPYMAMVNGNFFHGDGTNSTQIIEGNGNICFGQISGANINISM